LVGWPPIFTARSERRSISTSFIHAHRLRGAPPDLPFDFDEATVIRGLNFTLTTDLGDLDLLGEVAGGGSYEELAPRTEAIQIEGYRCLVVTLPGLIALKRAAGGGKDREALAELEALLEQRER